MFNDMKIPGAVLIKLREKLALVGAVPHEAANYFQHSLMASHANSLGMQLKKKKNPETGNKKRSASSLRGPAGPRLQLLPSNNCF